jgi:hypothetical protein
MKRPWCLAVCAVALASTAACGDEDALTQGHRGPCATATGPFVGCDNEPIETPEDACWKLVECGVIPLEEDWQDCVRSIERLSSQEQGFVMSCVEAASCDDLLQYNSPRDPYGERLCFEFGDTG